METCCTSMYIYNLKIILNVFLLVQWVAAWFIGSPAALISVSQLQHKAELEQLFPHGLFTTKSWLELYDFVFYSQLNFLIDFFFKFIFLYIHALQSKLNFFFLIFKMCLDFLYDEEKLLQKVTVADCSFEQEVGYSLCPLLGSLYDGDK